MSDVPRRAPLRDASRVSPTDVPRPAARPTPGSAEPWLRRFRPAGPVTVRLICLPHAGGWPSYFRPWSTLLPAYVDHAVVHYPGRESRDDEPCVTTMEALVDAVAEAVEPLRDLPLVLFGHSMGAAVVHELALRLQRTGAPAAHVVVSGRQSPTRRRVTSYHLADDATFLAHVRRLGGIPDEVIDHAELRELFLGPLRSDYRLIERYEPSSLEPVAAPLTMMWGTEDPHCSEAGALAWRDVAGRGFCPLSFPGGHFYLADDHAGPVAHLVRLLSAVASSAPRYTVFQERQR
ncbi:MULTISPECIES: thioesterase II family protein [unclassified Streptomyces]|uniref:thioesterase II family protein n=1 Tax=unclassified Streptomyces TaxID=2593676 RepID=UPI002965D1F5|nr:thioesterase domain-containing protein [Streptomyces sp. SJL17-1]